MMVYMLWGYRTNRDIPEVIGIYKQEDDAWKKFGELYHAEKKLDWKWLDIKKMEVLE